jgi:hypothetical protein
LINVQQCFSLRMWVQTKPIHHNKWIIESDHKLPRSYYHIKKVLQVVRLVINIRVKERVYSIYKNKVHIILMQRDAWYMRCVSYSTVTLWNSCSVDYLLPSLETFHSTTTGKKNCLFRDVTIHEVVWYVIKQKKMTQRNSCTARPKQIFMVLLITKTFALFLELCARL